MLILIKYMQPENYQPQPERNEGEPKNSSVTEIFGKLAQFVLNNVSPRRESTEAGRRTEDNL